jgi:hypothetical protein
MIAAKKFAVGSARVTAFDHSARQEILIADAANCEIAPNP